MKSSSSASRRAAASLLSNARLWLTLILAACLLLGGCATQAETQKAPVIELAPTASPSPKPQPVDIDLLPLNSGMAYAYVYNILNDPDTYIGKSIAIRGILGESLWEQNQTMYHFVTVSDKNACCELGVEYALTDAAAEYPAKGSTGVVTGVIGSYEEDGVLYYHIQADSLTVEKPAAE